MTLVYRDYDQAALDRQYNNQANVSEPRRYLDWYSTASEKARARVRHIADVAYGALPDERLDIFTPEGCAAGDRRPVVAFVHGGAWRHLGLKQSSFAAETFTARGALYVALGFSRMPAAGSLDEMVAQIRHALAWLYDNIAAHGGDPSRLYLAGHSSGAHLAAMALGTDWPRLYGLPEQIVRGAVLVSGIYDLEPVRLCYRNELLKLDRSSELRNSPCRNLPVSGPPALVVHAEFDTDEFRRQARDFAALWQRRCGNAELLSLAGLNHYDAAECLADPASHLTRRTLARCGL